MPVASFQARISSKVTCSLEEHTRTHTSVYAYHYTHTHKFSREKTRKGLKVMRGRQEGNNLQITRVHVNVLSDFHRGVQL